MSKRDTPVFLISTLVVTFGLSVTAIWSAYQFGFNSYSDVEYTYSDDTNVTEVTSKSNQKYAVAKTTDKPTPTVKKLKTGNDIAENPVQETIKFLSDSNQITQQDVAKLNQLEKEIAEFDHRSVGIRIHANFGESDVSRGIGQKRGEEVAGYLRHLGLKNKIVISRKIANSSQNTRNQAVIVKLYKL